MSFLRLEGSLLSVEGLLGRLDEREWPFAASAPEVVVVDGPEHDATHAFLYYVVGLLADHVLVVVADPEVVLVSVGTDLTRICCDDVPSGFINSFTNLKNKLNK
jgi:hypothetical protein